MAYVGQVALRQLLRAQHCMENRKMIPMCPKRHRNDQILRQGLRPLRIDNRGSKWGGPYLTRCQHELRITTEEQIFHPSLSSLMPQY